MAELLNVKTKSGFECEIDERVTRDYHLTELLVDLNSNDQFKSMGASVEIGTFILGKRQLNKLKNHVKDKDGFIDNDVFANEIGEILALASEQSNNLKK